MFTGFSGETVDFLWNVRLNNNREWFSANKDAYKNHVERPFKQLGFQVAEAFTGAHPQYGLALHLSRIYRDARRLFGRGPYKDHMWFSLRTDAEYWSERPTFWFELGPEIWSYGLGYYCAPPDTMARHRARLEGDPEPLRALDRLLASQSEFALEGERYARPKGGAPEGLEHWHSLKNFSLIHEQANTDLLASPALADRILAGFEFLIPFYDYFSQLDADLRRPQ